MNKHIDLVKKWLDDPESVTQKELKANAKAAWAARAESNRAAATNAAAWAAIDAYDQDPAYAARWVKRYEELTDE